MPPFNFCIMYCKSIRRKSSQYKSVPYARCVSMSRMLEVIELQGKLIDGDLTQERYDELVAAQFGQSPDPSQYQFTAADQIKMDAPSAFKVLSRLELGVSSIDSDHSEHYASRMGFVVPDKKTE